MSSTLRNGESRDLNLTPGDSITLVAVSGTYTATIVRGTNSGTVLGTNATGGTYGPYTSGAVVRVTTSAASEVDFDIGVTPVIVSDTVVMASTNPVTGGISYSNGSNKVFSFEPGISNGNLLTDWTNGTMGATSGSVGATAALDPTMLHNGKPMMKYTMGAAGTFQATFTFTSPITIAQLKTMQIPIRINRNTKDDGSLSVWGTAILWFNTSTGGRVQFALNTSGWRPGSTTVISQAAGAATQGWSFSGGPTDTNIWDADASTVTGINFVIVVNAGREENEPVWVGPITLGARRKGMVCIDFDAAYTSAGRWMLPMLNAQGLVSRLNLNHLNVGTGGYMTYAQIDAAYAAGHSVGSHIYQAVIGNGYSDFASEDAIYNDIALGYANLAQRGYLRDNYTHVRGGSVVDHAATVPHTKQVMISNAHARAGTKAIRYGSIIGGAYTRLQSIAGDFDELNVQGAIQVTSTTTAADLTTIVDRAIARGELAVITFHRSVVATPGSLEILNSDFDTFAQYLGAEVRKGTVLNQTFGEALRHVGAIN